MILGNKFFVLSTIDRQPPTPKASLGDVKKNAGLHWAHPRLHSATYTNRRSEDIRCIMHAVPDIAIRCTTSTEHGKTSATQLNA